jgi:tellurite resistance protein
MEHLVADRTMSAEADWTLKAMVAVAISDGRLDSREVGLIQQVYQDSTGRKLTANEIARVTDANATDDVMVEFAAASTVLDKQAKEEILRSAYLVLLADNRIAGEERKMLKEIATALQVPEIHFGSILEDLAIWMSSKKS